MTISTDDFANIFKRISSVIDGGSTCEPDIRHADLVVEELGLESARTVSTPLDAEKR